MENGVPIVVAWDTEDKPEGADRVGTAVQSGFGGGFLQVSVARDEIYETIAGPGRLLTNPSPGLDPEQ